MSTMNISLPDEMTNWVENEVKQGGFDNASEFFRQLVHEAKTRRAAEMSQSNLETLLVEGVESEGEVADEQWWANLRGEMKTELSQNKQDAKS